jgi:hypothetical protein
MYEMAKTAREKMKAKAKSLAGERDQKVDSSDWTPAEPLNAEAKTGLRPLTQRQYKKGGKVAGKAAKARADRMPRKSGGRTVEKDIGVGMANKDMHEANKSRPGVKHVGGFKEGGVIKDGGVYDKKALGAIDPQPKRAAAEHYKKGGTVKKAGGGGSWLEKMVGKPKTGSDLSQVGKDQTQRYSQEEKGALDRAIRGDDSLPSPDEAAESAARTGDKHGGRIKRKAGGMAKHPDVKEDKALVRKMVKKEALTGKKDGGEAGGKWIQKAISKPGAFHKQLGVPAGEKIPAKKLAKAAEKGGKLGKRARLAETLKRLGKAGGGALEMGGESKPKHRKDSKVTDIKINILAGGQRPPMLAGAPGAGMVPPPVGPAPLPPSLAGAAAAPPAMPMGGLPGAAVPGLPARKDGGRISKVAKSYKDMTAGAGSGEGRLQKTDIAKLHKDAPARKSGGKVDFKSIKDGAKGKTHLAGVKVEHCIKVRGK